MRRRNGLRTGEEVKVRPEGCAPGRGLVSRPDMAVPAGGGAASEQFHMF